MFNLRMSMVTSPGASRAPNADPRHAEHAVACAIEMQRARSTRNEDHRARDWPPLEMGGGHQHRTAVVGNMGSRRRIKYGVVGSMVEVFGSLHVLLPIGGAGIAPEAFDGKVIALAERDGARTARVRFTGLGWDQQERVEGFARSARGPAST